MPEFTKEEIEGIVHAMHQEPPTEKDAHHLPLRPVFSRVSFTHLEEEKSSLAPSELKLPPIPVEIEVAFGTSKMTIQELAHLQVGSLLPFDQLSQEPVDIYANGQLIGKGEILTSGEHYAVRILSFDSKIKAS